ncbi:hypothetical protein CDL12_27537 [Handroanthus impetiginosus]|uniref:Uncharacterized protein n=1 Tax=Handroanthus impetiginosus TaxID=429701 RepID=A0A2G9G498_9LAMI|nr:hypothetical protein CDL12_27537 [Handroanthus impetiginosus]
MSVQPRNDDASDLQEAAEEEEVLKLQEEVDQMAQKVLEYRTTLPDQLNSTLSSLLASQRPVLPTHLVEEGWEPETRTVPALDSENGVSQGPIRDNVALSVTDDPEEAEKIRLLKQKISSNASALPVVLNRMKEYMAKIDKLESSNGIIHPAFKRKRTS